MQTQTISEDSLPLWMRQARQGVDWGILVVMFFSLLVALPFLLNEGLPRTNASENYVYRTADYAGALRDGRLYPRWAESAFDGYGAPIHNYYEPGAPLIAGIIDVLFTRDTVHPTLAVRFLYAISLMLAGTVMYAFILRLTEASVAILASILYVYSPYIGLTAPHLIGDLPAVMAFALLPAVLWALNRIVLLNRSLDFTWLALASGLLILTDVFMSIVAFSMGGVLILWHLSRGESPRRVMVVLSALIFGVGLSACFWLPAWQEQDFVRWLPPLYERLPIHVDLLQLITPLQAIDLNNMLPYPQIALGNGIVIFMILGVISWVWVGKNRTFFALALIGGITLILIAEIVQRHELIAPAVFCLSLVGSSTLYLRERIADGVRRVIFPVMLVAIIGLSYPTWIPPTWAEDFGAVDSYSQIVYQQQGFGVAVLPPSVDIPTTLPRDYIPNRALIESYQEGIPIRIPSIRLTGEKQANLIAGLSHSDRFLIRTRGAVIFDVLRAYAPGWEANFEGNSLPLEPNPATGLTQVGIPEAREGTMNIVYSATPERRIAWAITWLAVIVLFVITIWRLLKIDSGNLYNNLNFISVQEARLLLVICAGFGITHLLFITPDSAMTLYQRAGAGLDNYVELRSRTDAGIELLAYDVNINAHDVDVSLAWRTARPLLANYTIQVFLQADDFSNIRWQLSEPRYPGGYPPRRWIPNHYIIDPHNLPLETLPAGTYRIGIQLTYCNPDCSPPVTFFNAESDMIGQTLLLPATIRVDG